MSDFFGIIPLNGQPAPDFTPDPFRLLAEAEAVALSRETLEVDNRRFLLLNMQAGEDVHVDEELALICYGDCYTKLLDPTFAAKKRLTATELASWYKQAGKRFPEPLKGSFALIVVERRTGEVHVYTDPLNLHSVYYTTWRDTAYVSSSLTALTSYLSAHDRTFRADNRAVADHYLFDFILDDHTYVEGIREMEPGSVLLLGPGGVRSEMYFDSFRYFDLSGPAYTAEEGAEQIKDILSRNIALYNEGPGRTAVALTGGFDSRSIAALLGDDIRRYDLYSYGRAGSWDLDIPSTIARRLDLNYRPIYLDQGYESVFPEYARLAVMMSDGAAEFTHANIAYVFANHLRERSSILTGLFGSEMIKIPSSRGMAISDHTIRLLDATDPAAELRRLLAELREQGKGADFPEEELVELIERHPFINNTLPPNEKYFHYLLMVGNRRYFRKEVKIQKAWKKNLYPFFDLEFISTLVRTPYPWVYNFATKKSLVKNLFIHKLYGTIIHTNPVLSDIISTHGYRPRYLLNRYQLPLLALEYYRLKKKISQTSGLSFQEALSLQLVREHEAQLFGTTERDIRPLIGNGARNRVKMASLQHWYQSVGLSL